MRSIIELHLDTDTASQSSNHGQSSRNQSSSKAKEKKLLSEIDVVGLLGTSSVGTYEVQCLLSRCQKFFESRRADHFPGLLASYHLLRRLFALLDELESQRQTTYSLEKEVNDMKKTGHSVHRNGQAAQIREAKGHSRQDPSYSKALPQHRESHSRRPPVVSTSSSSSSIHYHTSIMETQHLCPDCYGPFVRGFHKCVYAPEDPSEPPPSPKGSWDDSWFFEPRRSR
ncbi:hypothetical protein VKT23_011594 [Stygiomarasmius scandens]|uniref:Uncharacterized protein n=1 Tax=Marasmiellus scandens TaxID=2682957 RepID=A0ABR1JBA6_9AGAR